jgi:hypothetical protein
MLRLLPWDYWRLAPLVDGVPSYEGIQDDVDAAPFRESDETLVETASYLVDLDKYARRLEDESRTAPASTSHVVSSWREREQHPTLLCTPARAEPRPCDHCPTTVRERGWTPVRRCCTSRRTSAG